MIWYYGNGMRMMLPDSYQQRDVAQDMPAILETLQSFLGGADGAIADLIGDLESNVGWWGFDSAAHAISPTRLLVVRNEKFAGTPLNMLSGAVKLFLGNQADKIESTSLTLGTRDVVRFTYAGESSGWVTYTFKESGLLWLVVFMTTPANLAAQFENFEASVATFEVTGE